jgi:hypothetical protein
MVRYDNLEKSFLNVVVTDFAELEGVKIIFTVEFVPLCYCSHTRLYSSIERTCTSNLLRCLFNFKCAVHFINFWNMVVHCSCSVGFTDHLILILWI